MLPLIGSLISGGAGLLGSWFSSDTAAKNTEANIAMQRETNALNIAEAQKNRDFQQQMSSTAYQRASQDMTSAGLNPMMMFGSGSAASSPGGSQAYAQAPRSELRSPFQDLGHNVSQAINTAVAAKTMDKMTEEISNLIAENARIKATTGYVKQSTSTEEQRTGLTAAQKMGAEYSLGQAEVDYLEKTGAINKIGRENIRYVGAGKYVIEGVGKAIDAALPFVSGAKSAIRHLHEWRGSSSPGLTPSQTRELYDKFQHMRGAN